MKRRSILFALSLLLIVGLLSAGNAYAWISTLQGGSADSNYIKSGTITYSLGENDVFIANSEDVYPEQNLLNGTLNLSNSSDIPTCVRVKLVYSFGNGAPVVWSPSSNLSVTFAKVNNSDIWRYDVNDQYIYYNGNGGIVPATNGTTAATVPLFTRLCISGENTDNSIANLSVTVKLIYEARQSDFMESWTDEAV